MGVLRKSVGKKAKDQRISEKNRAETKVADEMKRDAV